MKRSILLAAVFGLWTIFLLPPASGAVLGKGDVLESLTVGKTTYTHVLVRDVTVRSITISNTEVIASIPLRTLSAELQGKFGYSAKAEEEEDDRLEEKQLLSSVREALLHQHRQREQNNSIEEKFARLKRNFDGPPDLRQPVDLRPRFRELAFGIKDQGMTSNCAIFSIVTALEFQNVELCGTPEKFSEEYLSWATRASLKSMGGENHRLRDKDEGFALSEVIWALQEYGIVPQNSLPDSFHALVENGEVPSEQFLAQARTRFSVHSIFVPGSAPQLKIGNLAHALNERLPVIIGLRWPNARSSRSGYLDQQSPLGGYRHAVTLVGYQSESGQLEDTVFLFKNSYGIRWGEAGYGRITYRYLKNNLLDAVVLDVRNKTDASSPPRFGSPVVLTR